MSSPAMSYPVPTQDEKTMALAACLLGVFSGFIGPLIIFFIRRESYYVKRYSLQVVLWHLGYTFVLTGAVLVMFFLFMIPMMNGTNGHAGPPPAFMLAFLPVWGVAMLGGLANIVLAVIGCIKASNGEWWRYPITGRIAERLLR
jgi:uncharacterized protein